MEDSIKLTKLELVLLELVDKGEGNWSWYELANALSRRDVPREPDIMVVLKKLAADGLLKRTVEPGSPRDRYSLTIAGTIVLRSGKKSDRIMMSAPQEKLSDRKVKLKQLQEWAQAQIDRTAKPEVRPDIGMTVLQLIDELEQEDMVNSL